MRPCCCRLPALIALAALWCVVLTDVTPAIAAEPIPDKLVVLTFDDGNTSDLRTVAPILKQHGFGATFFITSGWIGNNDRLTWSDVKQLQQSGFEIGCHTVTHPNLLRLSVEQIRREIADFDRVCADGGIQAATSFAYPGGHFDRRVMAVLNELGYTAGRRALTPERPLTDNGGNGRAYDPCEDDPYLIPGTLTRGIDAQEAMRIERALDGAKNGRIAVLIYHGIPVSTPTARRRSNVFGKTCSP